MEWVETTGRTVEEAKEAALDELGVDEVDAEFEVVAEAQTGLFGRLRSEARVRARVRPTAPRSKEDRRDRRRRGGQGSRAGSSPNGDEAGGASIVGRAPAAATGASGGPRAASTPTVPAAPAATPTAGVVEDLPGRGATPAISTTGAEEPAPPNGRSSRRRRRGNNRKSETTVDADPPQPNGADVELSLDEQARIAEDFLAQLTAQFGLRASVSVVRPDAETAELQLSGSDLGLLIGPKGSTLVAIQNLTRTVVFHETGATNGHLNVDVGGYRHKRTEALARFAKQVAADVREKGERTALEPMSAVDRKVVHDAISEIEGVTTISEGEEPRRRVIVLPASESSA